MIWPWRILNRFILKGTQEYRVWPASGIGDLLLAHVKLGQYSIAKSCKESRMLMKKLMLVLSVAGFSLGCAVHAASPEKTKYRTTYTANAKFNEVREQVVSAIGNKGLKINNISYIGKMLIRTGKDLGFKDKIYTHGQAFEFCSATVSRETMAADPHNIIFCPYIIQVYELAKQPGTVYLSYRRPLPVGSKRSKASLKAVEKLLDDIVRDAISWF